MTDISILTRSGRATLSILGLEDPGPFMTIVQTCMECHQEISRREYDVRDGGYMKPLEDGALDAIAVVLHWDEVHP